MAKKTTPNTNSNPQKLKSLPKKGFKFKLQINMRNIFLSLLVLMFVGPFILSLLNYHPGQETISLPRVLGDVKAGKIENIVIKEDELVVKYKEGGVIKNATKETSESFTQALKDAGIDPITVPYTIESKGFSGVWLEVIGILLPLILMGLFFFFILRQARGAQENMFSFGKSGAKIFAKGKQSTTFKDVAGVDEAKKELEEIVDFLKNPGKFSAIGARTPKGALLVGPAGVGKTLLARAVAGEAGVPYFSMAGSEFMEMLVGVGASRVRDLFSTAKKAAPAIIFIDEIDAIGRQRGNGMAGGHDEREQTLNQILVEMDGFTPNDNVVVLAATNRGDLLDPALLRPGRFDRRVVLDMPDKEGRLAILKIHSKGKKFVADVNWERISSRTVGFSGADLENMLNEAAILAARENKSVIEMDDVEEAATKVKLGPAKRRLQSKEDREITAYHEAGHALVAHVLPHVDPVHRISIVARGMSLGHTYIPPEADRSHETKTRLTETITMMLGGRVAEILIFKEMTAGASSDIENATGLARQMVTDFGMSSLGPINFEPQFDNRFGAVVPVSQAMQEKIDIEVKKIIDDCYKNAEKIIIKNSKKLKEVSDALMIHETLDRDEFEKIVGKPKNLN